LCHHPLARETGLEPDQAARLAESERAALAASAHVIATSATTAADLTAAYGVPAAKITIARPGTDPAPLAAGSAGEALALLAVGSLTQRKGHDRLIAALSGLVCLPWTLTIAGDRRDAETAAGLADHIATAGLQDRVILAGALDEAALSAAYHQADVFLLASHYEGFGMVYREAMARGLPVLATHCAAAEEATQGGAWLVAPEELAHAIETILTDSTARRAWAKRASQKAAAFGRWSDTARIVCETLRRVA
ncbi:MAG: glycosyltransferase, partial [Pseudomonadota bacterium]